MYGEIKTYELPKETDHVIEVIKSIPENWIFFEAKLEEDILFCKHPKCLEDHSYMYPNRELIISEYINTYALSSPDWRLHRESLNINFDELIRKKIFSRIKLSSAIGVEVSDLNRRDWIDQDSQLKNKKAPNLLINILKELTADFIKGGYKGRIDAHPYVPYNYYYHVVEHFILDYKEESISLIWDKRLDNSNNKNYLDQILQTCQKLGLKEIR